jgi:hypothetical protein
VCLPFLRKEQLETLERERVSGIDLCGNGVVIVPGALTVFRSGQENRFKSSAPIKNIYRRNSSLVGRVFLAQPRYETVQEICAEISRRSALMREWGKKPISLGTVSKALKTLEQDLVVSRKEGIRLLQPDTLLAQLGSNYVTPRVEERVPLKVDVGAETLEAVLWRAARETGVPVVATGLASVGRYAVMQRGNVLLVYCPRMRTLIEKVPCSQSERFPNLEIIQTDEETVYFDARQEDRQWWASPVQVYLELMAGDKRDQEMAEQVKTYVIGNLR